MKILCSRRHRTAAILQEVDLDVHHARGLGCQRQNRQQWRRELNGGGFTHEGVEAFKHMSGVKAGVHTRANGSMTAGAEKRLLIWIARRLPHAINPDHLSAIGLGAMGIAGASFAAMAWWPAAAYGVVVALAANWFGDSLDGTLARVRGHQRPRYGYYVDHVIDVAGTSMMMVGLACSGLMNPRIALAVLAAYLMVCAESYLAAHASGRFRLSFLRLGPTELRIVLAAGALKAAHSRSIAVAGSAPLMLFDVGGVVAIAGLLAAFAISAAGNARALYREEPLPREPNSRAA
jgi:archaetidylinositol phosphate synthase